jgi:transketolase
VLSEVKKSGTDIAELEKIASQIRRDIVRMVYNCQSGHPGGSLGCTDYFTALYFAVMKRKKRFFMEGKGEDMFFLSNGHISPVFYSTLARAGYFPVEEMNTFRKINSRLQGHPATHEGLPGVRVASGSLGQGLSVACGAALSKKMDGEKNIVWVLTGDGELEEGQIWEASMFAPHYKLDNLIVTVDWNGQQIDGPTEKRRAFKGKPIAVLMKTQMGYGVDFMMGSHKWHGVAPNKEQTETALAQLPETLGDF